MPDILFTYRRPPGPAPAGGDADVTAAWMAWFAELGDRIVEPGNPTGDVRTVGTAVAGSELGGWSVIRADDLDEAAALAKGCPVLSAGGSVEIGVITPVM
jgi:hypothetical protein